MATVTNRDVTNDAHWSEFANEWLIRADTTYLNHGSFGPPPEFVRLARRRWIDRLDSQPMDFYVREYEDALWQARSATAQFVGTSGKNLIFVENATAGMNVVARSFPLSAGDEVLSNNHEYGAHNPIIYINPPQVDYQKCDLENTFKPNLSYAKQKLSGADFNFHVFKV